MPIPSMDLRANPSSEPSLKRRQQRAEDYRRAMAAYSRSQQACVPSMPADSARVRIQARAMCVPSKLPRPTKSTRPKNTRPARTSAKPSIDGWSVAAWVVIAIVCSPLIAVFVLIAAAVFAVSGPVIGVIFVLWTIIKLADFDR
jgi:hypothetical protein